jgi:hypothetical protein
MENFKHNYLGVKKAEKNMENLRFARCRIDIPTPVFDSTPPPLPPHRVHAQYYYHSYRYVSWYVSQEDNLCIQDEMLAIYNSVLQMFSV